jgi:hypothetical protein
VHTRLGSFLAAGGGGGRGGAGGEDAQSRLGPIALSVAERGARRADAPGAQPAKPGELEVVAAAARSRRSGEREGSCRRCWSPCVSEALSRVATATSSAFLSGRLPRREVEPAASFLGTGWRAGPGSASLRVCRSQARWAGLSAGLELPPGRCRRCRPLSASARDCQVLWKSASGESNLSPEISNQSAPFPPHYTPTT